MSDNVERLTFFEEMQLPRKLDRQVKKKFDEINELIGSARYREALDFSKELTSELLNNLDFADYLEFDNIVAKTLYALHNNLDVKKFISKSDERDKYGITKALFTLGSLLIENDYPKEAVKPLEMAHSINPYSEAVASEYIEALKINKEWDKAEEIIKEFMQNAVLNRMMRAKLLRDLGFIEIEKNNLELATVLFLISCDVVNTPLARSELEYIQHLNHGSMPDPRPKDREIRKYLKENEMINSASDIKNLGEVFDFLKEFEKDESSPADLVEDLRFNFINLAVINKSIMEDNKKHKGDKFH